MTLETTSNTTPPEGAATSRSLHLNDVKDDNEDLESGASWAFSSSTLEQTQASSRYRRHCLHRGSRPLQIALLICVLGSLATAAFFTLGILSAAATQSEAFSQHTAALVQQVHIAWLDYEVATLWTHQACTANRDNMTHVQFRELYEQIASTGIDVQIEFLPFVSHAERPRYEARMRSFLAEYYPYVEYKGFVGLEPHRMGIWTCYLAVTPTIIIPFISWNPFQAPNRPWIWTFTRDPGHGIPLTMP